MKPCLTGGAFCFLAQQILPQLPADFARLPTHAGFLFGKSPSHD